MRDRLIELLDNSPQLDALYGDYDNAADWLIANGVTVQEWISVKDRLPEKHTDVLCYQKYEPERPDIVCENHYICGGLWRFDGSNVTHWMPLPQPPKGA